MTHLITIKVSETHHHLGPVKIVSIVLLADGAGTGNVSVYNYQDTSGRVILHEHASLDQANQLIFQGIVFPDGFSAVADANTQFAMIEYEPIP